MVQKTVLDNGIRIVTEAVPAALSVTVGVWVEVGSRHEPSELGGISHFVEHMLFKGTPRRSAQAIAKEIDSVGGVLNGFTGREFSCFYAKVMAEKLPLAVDLLADIIRNPLYDLDELEKERRVILQEISMQEDTPDDLVHDLFNQTFWGDHPLARPVIGSRDSVGAIERQSLCTFSSERYHGGSILVCVAGHVEHEPLVALVSDAFGKVVAGTQPLPSQPVYRRQVQVCERDLEQVHLCLGTRALPQNHPNRFAGFLLNTILGGSMSSRLFQTVREERGLAYAIYSYLNCHSDAGSLVVYAGTAPDDAPHVVNLVLRELRRLRSEAVADEELNFAKEQLKGNLLLSLESSDNCMSRLAKNEIYLGRHLPVDELLRQIFRVTSDDLLRLADFLLRDDYLNLQVLGRTSAAEFPLCDLTFGLPAEA